MAAIPVTFQGILFFSDLGVGGGPIVGSPGGLPPLGGPWVPPEAPPVAPPDPAGGGSWVWSPVHGWTWQPAASGGKPNPAPDPNAPTVTPH